MTHPPGWDDLYPRLADGLRLLPDKPEETPESTLRALWHAAAGHPLSPELAMDEPLAELDGDARAQLAELIERRRDGVPLAHLTGRQRFMDVEFHVSPGGLIPRKETEILAGAAIEMLSRRASGALVVDACTGIGNVAIAVAHHVPHAQVFAVDISEEALEVARQNVALLGLARRVTLAAGDLFEPVPADLRGALDLISCNPPYISSARVDALPDEIGGHEPRLAFDGGPFGVSILTRVIREAPGLLKPGGVLCMEVGAGQGEMMTRKITKSGAYSDIRTVADGEGVPRVVTAVRT